MFPTCVQQDVDSILADIKRNKRDYSEEQQRLLEKRILDQLRRSMSSGSGTSWKVAMENSVRNALVEVIPERADNLSASLLRRQWRTTGESNYSRLTSAGHIMESFTKVSSDVAKKALAIANNVRNSLLFKKQKDDSKPGVSSPSEGDTCDAASEASMKNPSSPLKDTTDDSSLGKSSTSAGISSETNPNSEALSDLKSKVNKYANLKASAGQVKGKVKNKSLESTEQVTPDSANRKPININASAAMLEQNALNTSLQNVTPKSCLSVAKAVVPKVAKSVSKDKPFKENAAAAGKALASALDESVGDETKKAMTPGTALTKAVGVLADSKTLNVNASAAAASVKALNASLTLPNSEKEDKSLNVNASAAGVAVNALNATCDVSKKDKSFNVNASLSGVSVKALNASAVVEPDSATLDVHGFRLNCGNVSAIGGSSRMIADIGPSLSCFNVSASAGATTTGVTFGSFKFGNISVGTGAGGTIDLNPVNIFNLNLGGGGGTVGGGVGGGGKNAGQTKEAGGTEGTGGRDGETRRGEGERGKEAGGDPSEEDEGGRKERKNVGLGQGGGGGEGRGGDAVGSGGTGEGHRRGGKKSEQQGGEETGREGGESGRKDALITGGKYILGTEGSRRRIGSVEHRGGWGDTGESGEGVGGTRAGEARRTVGRENKDVSGKGGRGNGGGGGEEGRETAGEDARKTVDGGGRGRMNGSWTGGGEGVEETEQAEGGGEHKGRNGSGIQKKPSEPVNEDTSKAMQLAVELLAKEDIPNVEELVRQAACNPSFGSDDQDEDAISDFELCDFCKNKGHPCCMSCLMKATSSSRKTVKMGGNIHGFSP